ncbi:MAG: acyl-CoA dehydrogenase family protein, partial [Myxococcota bacterium]
MTAAPPTFDDLRGDPALTALMPLLYVAWADGELTEDEVRAIETARGDGWAAQSEALSRWLSPENPPTSTELLRIYAFVQARLPGLDVDTRSSLAELGLQLAELPEAEAEATRTALEEMEAALDIEPKEGTRELWAERPPVEQHFDEPAPAFEPARMTEILDGEYARDWALVRKLAARPELAYRYDVDKSAYREAVLEWLRILSAEGLGRLGYPEAFGGGGRMDRFVKTFEALGMHDLSLVVKYGVQFGLFGGAILNLGTERHHRRYLEEVGAGRLLGGFAMTELGHGSNVRDVETIARYLPEREVFVIHSPSSSSRKEWIGNAAVHGTIMVVFAQLEIGPTAHGVHAFVVPVRDEHGQPLPGVTISDCGEKMGLNGVDNGRLHFDHVEVPRDALLDRYATVAADGSYESPIASPSRRFFTMLGTLVGGRISVASASVSAAKSVLAIAVRYGALRRQFGPADGPERCVLDYRTHQLRLFTRLATTYALHFTVDDLQARWRDGGEANGRELETLAAVVKVAATWHAIDAAQMARECCGGMGFLSANRIAEFRKDVDVFATFEGDNTVLLQLA